jgi:SAM-dependent methyltransferase
MLSTAQHISSVDVHLDPAQPGAAIKDAEARRLEPGYRLAAAGRETAEAERLHLLEQIFDPVSRQRRALVQPGWRCLEVGGGQGSMAAWLAEQVGPTGHVVVTDIDTRYLQRLDLPNLDVVEHNILEDPLEVLGLGSFDLVCSRLTPFWLAGRQDAAITQMAKCLRPGGWLIDEDADWGTPAPIDPSHPLYADYHDAWSDGDWWTIRGYDKAFGRKLPALFDRCGLADIRHEAATEVVRGGSPWTRWWAVSLEVINELGGGGAVESYRRELDLMTTALADPTVWIMRELLHACWGRRPATANSSFCEDRRRGGRNR